MGTEILHPQDCLIERLRSVPSTSSQTFANRNPRSYRKPAPKKRDLKKSPNSNLVLGQVTILKRGESIDFKGNDRNKTVYFDDRAMVAKEIRMTDLKTALSLQSDVYAGSAFSQSPSPSSLPLPTFSRKKEGLDVVDDSATKDLRRLLRIG